MRTFLTALELENIKLNAELRFMGNSFMVGRPAMAESNYYNVSFPLSNEGAEGKELKLNLEKITKKFNKKEITKGATYDLSNQLLTMCLTLKFLCSRASTGRRTSSHLPNSWRGLAQFDWKEVAQYKEPRCATSAHQNLPNHILCFNQGMIWTKLETHP